MVTLAQLWLPILVSAVVVFLASSVLHMVLPYHKKDFGALPNEDRVLDALRAQGVGPGNYMFPKCGSMKETKTPEMQEKFRRGPVGTMTVFPGINMGKSLMQWFVYTIVVGAVAGYIGTLCLAPSAQYPVVFRVVGTGAITAYSVGVIQDSIWKGVKWGTTFKFIVDGIVYGLLTAGVFGWLWPR
jgi:hypothetical protein